MAPDGGDLPERRRPRRVQAPDQHLLGRVRPVARRRGQHPDQVGLERSSTAASTSSTATTPSTPTTSSTTAPGRPKPDFKQNQFGGTLGGPIYPGQDVLLRRLPGPAHQRRPDLPLDRAVDEDAQRRLLRDQPRHLRPADAAAVPGQHHPAQPLRSGVGATSSHQLYPEPNTAGTHRRQRAEPINNYLINPTLTRNDDQFDVKIDHVLTRQQPHLLPLQLPEDAARPAGDAAARRRGRDVRRRRGQHQGAEHRRSTTPTRSASGWLNEFRFGWNSIKFFMTPIDYGTNPAAAVGIPGINLNEATSAMTQLDVPEHPEPGRQQQPAADHQPERLPVLRQRDLAEGPAHAQGGRQRHAALARDPERRHHRRQLRVQQQPDVELRRAWPAAARINAATGFDVASFLLGFAASKTRNLFDAETYTEKRPEYALYVQDDFRVTNKLTLNARPALGRVRALDRGGQPPVELRRVDRPLRRRVGQRGRSTASRSGRYLQTYSKGDFAPRLGFAYDVRGDGRTIVRGGFGVFWNFTPGGTSSSKAQNPPFLQSTALTTDGRRRPPCASQDGLPPPPGVDPNRPAAGTTRSIFDINFRDAYAQNWNINVQQAVRRQLRARARLRRLARPAA